MTRWLVIGKDDPEVTPGGLNRYVQGLVSGLVIQGRSVEWLVSGPAVSEHTRSLGQGRWPRKVAAAVLYGMRRGQFDVVNVHFALYGAPFLSGVAIRHTLERLLPASSRRFRPPVVVHFHGPWAAESSVAGERRSALVRVKAAVERFCLLRADAVVTLSDTFTGAAVRYGVAPARIHVIPPGISQDWFSIPSEQEQQKGSVDLICVRRLTPRMGHVELLNALEKLDFRVRDRTIRLHIVGDGDQRSVIERWVVEQHREDCVHLHGRLSDTTLKDLLGRSQMSIVPTVALEGFGLIVLEAFAMGVPVISTGQGGLRSAMGPWGREPYLFDLAEPTTLANSLEAGLALSADWEGRRAMQEYAESHDWVSVSARIEGLARVG